MHKCVFKAFTLHLSDFGRPITLFFHSWISVVTQNLMGHKFLCNTYHLLHWCNIRCIFLFGYYRNLGGVYILQNKELKIHLIYLKTVFPYYKHISGGVYKSVKQHLNLHVGNWENTVQWINKICINNKGVHWVDLASLFPSTFLGLSCPVGSKVRVKESPVVLPAACWRRCWLCSHNQWVLHRRHLEETTKRSACWWWLTTISGASWWDYWLSSKTV